MRILVAFDKFKEAIGAPEACAAAAAALRARQPGWTFDLCPLTDGGDGFARLLTEAAGAVPLRARVTGPRGDPVEAAFGLVAAERVPAGARAQLEGAGPTLAVIEMAQASGLALLPAARRDPWQAGSLGTGELIREAVAHGAGAIVLGVGGSATHDLGLGALSALGFEFRDADGRALLPPVPSTWERLACIEGGARPGLPPVFIACDVDNPLLGPRGAAAVYAPQKGLRPEDLARLEMLGARVAAQLCARCGRPASLADTPGAGAAGGMAFGLMAGLGARLLPGFDFVASWLDLDRRLAAADLVVTGEGRFDDSSLAGKGPGALAARALAQGKPVHVFAGSVAATARPGLHLHAITPAGVPLEQALRETAPRLATAVQAAF